MTRLNLLLILCMVFFTKTIAQKPIFCKPVIKKATVFYSQGSEFSKGGSQIEMEVSVKLKQGTNRLLFINMPKHKNFQLIPEDQVNIVSQEEVLWGIDYYLEENEELIKLKKEKENIEKEIAKYGNPTIKRIYGDWTKPDLSKWKNVLLENAITPIQQYGYTTGKNATDSAMIIDAMDILYSEKVNGFCIVSSDSDFTRLATRLREAGM